MILKDYSIWTSEKKRQYFIFYGKHYLVCMMGTDLTLASYPGKMPDSLFRSVTFSIETSLSLHVHQLYLCVELSTHVYAGQSPDGGGLVDDPETESSSSKSGSLGFGPGSARLRLDIDIKKRNGEKLYSDSQG